MTREEEMQHRYESRYKWQKAVADIAAGWSIASMRLSFNDCGYCKIHGVDRCDRDGCCNCVLQTEDLCCRGFGKAYRAVARLRDYHRWGACSSREIETAALAGARAILEAIEKDIAEQEPL